MRIPPDVDEAAERLEELIELAACGDAVLIRRAGRAVAELNAIPKPTGSPEDLWALAEDGRVNVPAGATLNCDDFHDEHGLPK